MKIIKIFLGLFFIVGIIIPILSVYVYDNEHNVVFAPISILSAFTGTGLIFGFKGFKKRPKHIGNLDETMPVINQNWAVFFISCIINLLIANLCG